MKGEIMAKEKYWAGFCNNRIAETLERYGDNDEVLAIYLRKKDAKRHYEDVRQVKISEIKRKKVKNE